MATILELLFACRPAHVSRFVVAFVVGPSVEGVLGRRFAAYVSQESRVIVPKKGYAGSAVAIISMVVRVIATAACLFPTKRIQKIFFCLSTLRVLSRARGALSGGCFAIPATAGFSMAADKMPRGDQPPLTAIATTEPNRIAVAAHMTETYNGQAIKTLIRKIFSCRHKEAL